MCDPGLGLILYNSHEEAKQHSASVSNLTPCREHYIFLSKAVILLPWSHPKGSHRCLWNVTPPPSSETTGTSTNWNFACKVTMPGPSAAWIRVWIETDSLWKPTVAVGVQASSLHLLIGWTEKTLDCIRSLILPLSNPISEPAPIYLLLHFHKNIMLPCYTHMSVLYKTIPVKNSQWIYIWKHL